MYNLIRMTNTIENFEKTPKTVGYNPKVYRKWNGKKCKSNNSITIDCYWPTPQDLGGLA